MNSLDIPASPQAATGSPLLDPSASPTSNPPAPAEPFDDVMQRALGTLADELTESLDESANEDLPSTATDEATSASPQDQTVPVNSETAAAASVLFIVPVILTPQTTATASSSNSESQETAPQSSETAESAAAVGVDTGKTTINQSGASPRAASPSSMAKLPASPADAQSSLTSDPELSEKAGTSKDAPAATATSPNPQGGVSKTSQAELNPRAVAPSTSSIQLTPSASTAPIAPAAPTAPTGSTETTETFASVKNAQATSAATSKPAEQNLPVTATSEGPKKAIEVGQEAGETADSSLLTRLHRLPGSHGTSGAKYPLPMQKADNKNDFTGSPEQKLPVTATSTVAEPLLAKVVRSGFTTFSPEKSETATAVDSSASTALRSSENISATQPVSSVSSARAVERAHDLMALHGMRLRDSGNDSMQVIIKPSPDLHLALNLQMRNGAVEVSAQLQRGDYDLLNRHWMELQQQLEYRGVRLAPLSQSDSNPSGQSHSGNNASFSQHSGSRQHSEEKAAKTGAFAEFAFSNVLVPKRTNKTTSPRGWESWA